MKTVFSKTNLPAFLLLLILLPAFTSCEKDKKPSLRGDIVGEWELKSFTVDGVELKGSIVLASEMEFEAYSGSNGDFKWSINYIDGSSEIVSGDYTLDEEDAEVELENNTGERLKFDVEINGDDLELSGTLEGERYELKAERD
ncbi:MAG: lipocalin family protein [Lewinellaceae bacterium]|nr:lipocalin family protein [Lewinellaceae bacterium]MBP6811753.1 lipocalin family protein [Saprospiraceae bacterium]